MSFLRINPVDEMALNEINISAAENHLSLAEFDNSVVGNCIHNIDRIKDLIEIQ